MIWRLVTSPYITDPMHIIETKWSIDDLYISHDALDVREELERVSSPQL